MNLLSASVAVRDPDTESDRMAIVLIPADLAGIERSPFWKSTALAGAKGDQVSLDQVFVPDALIFLPQDYDSMDPVRHAGSSGLRRWYRHPTWARRQPRRTRHRSGSPLRRRPGRPGNRTGDGGRRAGARGRGCADLHGQRHPAARALCVRFATERTLERVVMAAAAAAWGIGYVESPEIAYVLGATRALAYHPPRPVRRGDRWPGTSPAHRWPCDDVLAEGPRRSATTAGARITLGPGRL